MNAQARDMTAGRAEHISLEADSGAAPLRQPHRPTLATYTLHSALRGCTTEVRILQDHFLSVQYQRPGEATKKFTFDLRFANPRPVRVRHIAWLCLAGLVASALGAAAGFVWARLSAGASLWTHPGFFLGVAGLAAAGVMTFLFLRRTTEALQFTSAHGNAILVNLVGGIGAAKAGKSFLVELIKHINAARQVRAQAPAHFLRDEMREHHRLRELDVLTQAEYEASKARILAAHG